MSRVSACGCYWLVDVIRQLKNFDALFACINGDNGVKKINNIIIFVKENRLLPIHTKWKETEHKLLRPNISWNKGASIFTLHTK